LPRFLLRRLAFGLVVLWAVGTLVFVLSRVVGDPARLSLPEGSPPEMIEARREELGLTAPAWEQYTAFLKGAVSGDLGESTWVRAPVWELITAALPNTLLLAAVTITASIVVGLTLALWAVASRSKLVDRVIMLMSFASVSLPEFWFGLILISTLAVNAQILPTSGMGDWKHLVLPVITGMIRPTGRLAQTTRRALMESMRMDYCLAALAKGLPRNKVLRRHALPNSLLLVITLVGDELANLLAGVVIIETIFAWPGVGYLTIQAITNRDPFLVVGIVLTVSALVLLMNLAADLLYGAADPRVRAGAMLEPGVA
jgi:peptide/nickel transport system permease protein